MCTTVSPVTRLRHFETVIGLYATSTRFNRSKLPEDSISMAGGITNGVFVVVSELKFR